jgi:predicted lipoprotein with Yx(FWY)xxD motif
MVNFKKENPPNDTTPTSLIKRLNLNDSFSFLIDYNNRPLYVFRDDAFMVSNCTDNCLIDWTPITLAENYWPEADTGV